MIGFFEKMFNGLLNACTIVSFSGSLASNFKELVKCISLNNQPCQARPTLADINSNETFFYPLTVNVNKGGATCNTINDLYAQVSSPNNLKIMNVEVFNLMPGVNETRNLVQQESSGCKCGLNENVSNLKQKWDLDECWCGCKELDEWGSSKDCYMKNTSTHDSECNKTCTIYE